METYNNDYYKVYGRQFCRCYLCIFPILLKKFQALQNEAPDDILKKMRDIIQALNDDYVYSADFRMQIHERSGLECGYDCIHYEERLEASPLIFWEINDSKETGFEQLIKLFKDDGFLSLFS